MSKAHFTVPNGPLENPITVRLGAGTGATNNMSVLDEGKLVKLVGESRYDLCQPGDPIEGCIIAISPATSGGYSVGTVGEEDYLLTTADGLQATPGTGTLNVGDYVVAGTLTAKGTQLTTFPKVCKATVQPGDVPGSLTAASAQTLYALHAWRVISLGLAGTGAVGTTICIQPVN
jgi:hypothetical protein